MTTSGPPQIWSSSDFPHMCLKDERRTRAFGEAIAHTVTPGDVVVAEIIDTGLLDELQVPALNRLRERGVAGSRTGAYPPSPPGAPTRRSQASSAASPHLVKTTASPPPASRSRVTCTRPDSWASSHGVIRGQWLPQVWIVSRWVRGSRASQSSSSSTSVPAWPRPSPSGLVAVGATPPELSRLVVTPPCSPRERGGLSRRYRPSAWVRPGRPPG